MDYSATSKAIGVFTEEKRGGDSGYFESMVKQTHSSPCTQLLELLQNKDKSV